MNITRHLYAAHRLVGDATSSGLPSPTRVEVTATGVVVQVYDVAALTAWARFLGSGIASRRVVNGMTSHYFRTEYDESPIEVLAVTFGDAPSMPGQRVSA